MDRRKEKLAGTNSGKKKPSRLLDLHGLLPARHPGAAQGSPRAGACFGSRLIRELGTLRQFNVLGRAVGSPAQTGQTASASRDRATPSFSAGRGLLLRGLGCSSHQLGPRSDPLDEARSTAARASRKASSSQLGDLHGAGLSRGAAAQLRKAESYLEKKPSLGSLASGPVRKSSVGSIREDRTALGVPARSLCTNPRQLSEAFPLHKVEELIGLLEDRRLSISP